MATIDQSPSSGIRIDEGAVWEIPEGSKAYLLLSFFPVWPGLIVIALMLGGYFLLPGLFYLWMGILVGGGMISLGVYVRTRW